MLYEDRFDYTQALQLMGAKIHVFDEHTAVFAATASDVVQVIADGQVVFEAGDEHEIGRDLDDAIGRLWR